MTIAWCGAALLWLARLCGGAEPGQQSEAQVIGRSHEGRDLMMHRIGSGPMRILLLAGIHGDESESTLAMPELIAWLDAHPGLTTWLILPDVNPDGALARRRVNARGVDLNRNWPARNFAAGARHGARPLSEPEARAAHDAFHRFAPHLILSLHSAGDGPFVNFDGPARCFADRFVDAAVKLDPRWRVKADMGYPTPGSLGSFAGVDQAIPVLTIELRRGERAPWAALRAGLGGLQDGIL